MNRPPLLTRWASCGRCRPTMMVLLALLLINGLMALLAGIPTEQVEYTPDSYGYHAVADKLLALDLSGLRDSRAAAFPLLLAIQKGLHLPYFATVQLFNLLGIALLVWRLWVYGLGRTALMTALVATVLLWSDKQFGFTTLYLREGMLIGITGIHLALLLEVCRSRRGLAVKLALVALALLVAFHFKGMYLYTFTLSAPWLLWATFRQHGWRSAKAVGAALLFTGLLIPLVWISNPNNDQNLKGLSLIGMLINSDIPRWVTTRPELLAGEPRALELFKRMDFYKRDIYKNGHPTNERIDPFSLQSAYQKHFKESLADEGEYLLLQIIRHQPGPMMQVLGMRSLLLPKRLFVTDPGGMCLRYWGLAGGLIPAVCKPLSIAVFGLWMVLPLAVLLLVVTGLQQYRSLPPQTGWVVALGGMSSGLVVLVSVVGYTDFERLFYAGFVYGALTLPWWVTLVIDGLRQQPETPSPAGAPKAGP